ncbi:DUF2840 domain-containing protein [Methylocystis sp. JR02]|uniref:DUF2840 domain-containing protein n=1 Tax=Methylocystis sp. JR02 TaxID=3046284 RepID=UPI0024B8CD5A|nr:DUF2840 domain-containing protein [Methylocystis sp. JR02]MDJ0448808.1 DUF2840 domain-containing protein [Methylocystis sp. JR02]
MNDNEPSPQQAMPPAHRRAVTLTHVELTWIEKKIEHWLRFGRRAEEKILDRRRSIASFTPNSIFAFVRWASNDYGTIISRMDIVRAVEAGARFQTLPFVRPGGEILLRVDSWPKVERALRAIDAIEALRIDPADVAPEYWRHLHNRLAAGHEPRAYTREQHAAWLKRRSVTR